MIIQAKEKYLSFRGFPQDAITLVNSLRNAYSSQEMPKVLNDFVFNIEVSLQNDGWLDEDFNLVGEK
jgi:hypothetical protein